jgi:hypothetical protein
MSIEDSDLRSPRVLLPNLLLAAGMFTLAQTGEAVCLNVLPQYTVFVRANGFEQRDCERRDRDALAFHVGRC